MRVSLAIACGKLAHPLCGAAIAVHAGPHKAHLEALGNVRLWHTRKPLQREFAAWAAMMAHLKPSNSLTIDEN